MVSRHFRITLAYGVFLLTGIAGLGYQVIWARLFLAGMGHEMPALIAVVAAFMCGLALGAWILDRPVSGSRRPALWFSGMQAVAGLWGLVTLVLVPGLNPVVTRWLGADPTPVAQWTAAFGLVATLLLPATAALGGSFAAMERILTEFAFPGRHVAPLYAANTLGAALGVLAAAGWLMPMLGLRASGLLFAGIALLSAALTLSLDCRTAAAPARALVGESPGSDAWPRHRLMATLVFTGLLGIGYQLIVVHVLAQVLDNTVYTYATMLTVYLAGTALGAAGYRRFLPEPHFRSVLIGLCGLLATTCFVGIIVLGQSDRLVEGLRSALPVTWAGRTMVETATVALVFLAPTLVMGATWSHLVQAARCPDAGIGTAIAVNALGAAMAPLLFGVMLLPVLGAKWVLTVIALGYLALAPRPVGWQWAWLTAPLSLAVLLPANLRILDLPPGADVVAWRESLLGTAAVVREPDQNRTLRVDNRFQMGGTGSTEMAARHAHLALLLHPAPKRALVLGVGTGLTLGATTVHAGLEADGVELVPQVVGLMSWFEPENREANRHPQIRMHTADARRFVLVSRDSYDVIIGDLFHPARDGAGLLYTREHFAAIRRRLAPEGLFCQWLPLHQMGEETLRLITRTFLEVFPDAQAWLLRYNVEVPVVALVGFMVPPAMHPEWIERRIHHEPLGAELRAFALGDSLRFFGHWLAGPAELEAFAGTGPLNTDDRPLVQFLAARQPMPEAADIHRRLAMMLNLRQPGSSCWFAATDNEKTTSFMPAWRAFVNARDVYLEGLMHDAQGRRQLAIDAYLESARLSREFTAGYAQCLTTASLFAPTEPAAARALLERLVEAQPGIPVARQMLERLGDGRRER